MRRRRSNRSTYRNRGIPSGCEGIGIKPKACGSSGVISQSCCTCVALRAHVLSTPVEIISTGADLVILIPRVLSTDAQLLFFFPHRLCFDQGIRLLIDCVCIQCIPCTGCIELKLKSVLTKCGFDQKRAYELDCLFKLQRIQCYSINLILLFFLLFRMKLVPIS